MLTAQEKITKAKVSIILSNALAFFASLMMKKPFIVDNSIPTGCTNGKVIKYNPAYIDSLSQDEVVFFICHELMHLTLLHHVRREGRDLEMWNEAADYAINPILKNAKLKLIKGVLINSRFDNMSAETIYRILEQEKRDEEQKKKQQQQQDDNEQKDEQDDQPSQPDDNGQESPDNTSQDDSGNDTNDADSDESQDSDAQDAGNDGNSDGNSDSDSDSKKDDDGQESPANDSKQTDFGVGGVVDAPAATKAEMEQAEAETKQEIAAALQIAKAQGKSSAFLEKMVAEVLQPRIAWQEVLSRFIADTDKSDYNFLRPNRRFSGRIVMPSLHKETIGGIVLVIDTSISVYSRLPLLKRFATEMQEVCSMIQSPITVIHCDTQVRGEADIIEPDDTFELKPRGGGGTDFRPPFEWLEEQGIDVKCVVYFTDMECYSYPEEPEYPVLWARYGSDRSVPPFGEIIQVDEYRVDD